MCVTLSFQNLINSRILIICTPVQLVFLWEAMDGCTFCLGIVKRDRLYFIELGFLVWLTRFQSSGEIVLQCGFTVQRTWYSWVLLEVHWRGGRQLRLPKAGKFNIEKDLELSKRAFCLTDYGPQLTKQHLLQKEQEYNQKGHEKGQIYFPNKEMKRQVQAIGVVDRDLMFFNMSIFEATSTVSSATSLDYILFLRQCM